MNFFYTVVVADSSEPYMKDNALIFPNAEKLLMYPPLGLPKPVEINLLPTTKLADSVIRTLETLQYDVDIQAENEIRACIERNKYE